MEQNFVSVIGWRLRADIMISENGVSQSATSFRNNVRVPEYPWFSNPAVRIVSSIHDVSNGARLECAERCLERNEHRCSGKGVVSLRVRYLRV